MYCRANFIIKNVRSLDSDPGVEHICCMNCPLAVTNNSSVCLVIQWNLDL